MKDFLKDCAIVYGIIFGIMGFLTLCGLIPYFAEIISIITIGIFTFLIIRDTKELNRSLSL